MGVTDERRQWRRRTLDTTILFRSAEEGGGPFRSGQMRDVSDGGIAFDTEDPPAEGALIDLFFKEHDTAADQRVRGRVAWTRPGDAGMCSVGVRFVN